LFVFSCFRGGHPRILCEVDRRTMEIAADSANPALIVVVAGRL
jgi:hypothetical protein